MILAHAPVAQEQLWFPRTAMVSKNSYGFQEQLSLEKIS
jgi:hypothetical protein